MPEKYQDEIEEILKQAEQGAPPEPTPTSRGKPARGTVRRADSRRPTPARSPESGEVPPHSSRRWPAITPGKLMLAGLVIFLIAAVLRWFLVIWVGLGMLAVAYLMFFIRPTSSSTYERRWRGKAVDDRLSPWQRFTRWLRS